MSVGSNILNNLYKLRQVWNKMRKFVSEPRFKICYFDIKNLSCVSAVLWNFSFLGFIKIYVCMDMGKHSLHTVDHELVWSVSWNGPSSFFNCRRELAKCFILSITNWKDIAKNFYFLQGFWEGVGHTILLVSFSQCLEESWTSNL